MNVETKSEFLHREKNWLAAIKSAPSNQRKRVLSSMNTERIAHGLKPIHKP